VRDSIGPSSGPHIYDLVISMPIRSSKNPPIDAIDIEIVAFPPELPAELAPTEPAPVSPGKMRRERCANRRAI
jgi:hypothetical protein